MVRGDLEATLADLMARRAAGELPAFERIVIETSGLADPAPVLNAVMAETGRGAGFVLEGVVTTVDAVTGARTLSREAQSVRQVAVADRLIVTKVDLVPDGPDQELMQRLRAFNTRAEILPAVRGKIAPAALIGGGHSHDFTGSSGAVEAAPAAAHDVGIACVTLRRARPLPALALPLFLEALADHVGADLLRLKALIHVAEHPARPAIIHGVQHLFHEPQWLETWPSEDRSSRMVLIGRGLTQLWVERLLEAIVAEVDEVGETGGGM
jgi:G3E family GTPase